MPALRVRVLVAAVLLGLNDAVTPDGSPVKLKATLLLNPFFGETPIVVAPPVPCAILNAFGEAVNEKSGVATAFTVTLSVVVWANAPDVPVIVTVFVPAAAADDALSVSVLDALPFAPGVTGLEENAAETPLGSPEALRLVAALNPLRLVMDTVLVPLAPGLREIEVGAVLSEKSGVGTVVATAKMRSSDSSYAPVLHGEALP